MGDREAHSCNTGKNFSQIISVPGKSKDSSKGKQYESGLYHDKVGTAS